jgi:hypothetical protein
MKGGCLRGLGLVVLRVGQEDDFRLDYTFSRVLGASSLGCLWNVQPWFALGVRKPSDGGMAQMIASMQVQLFLA